MAELDKVLYDLVSPMVEDKESLSVKEMPSDSVREVVLHVYAKNDDIARLIVQRILHCRVIQVDITGILDIHAVSDRFSGGKIAAVRRRGHRHLNVTARLGLLAYSRNTDHVGAVAVGRAAGNHSPGADGTVDRACGHVGAGHRIVEHIRGAFTGIQGTERRRRDPERIKSGQLADRNVTGIHDRALVCDRVPFGVFAAVRGEYDRETGGRRRGGKSEGE